MKNHGFWVVNLCLLLVMVKRHGIDTPLAVALLSNVLVLLLDIFEMIRRRTHGRNKAED